MPVGWTNRRAFIAGLGGAAAWPLAARGQGSNKRPLIAVLSAVKREDNAPLKAFVQGMRELGYVDGQNIDWHSLRSHDY